MSRSFIASFLIVAFTACTTASAADKAKDMYAGKTRTSDELSVIYNPSRFIQKIDHEALSKSPYPDSDDHKIELMRVLPGSHTIGGVLNTDTEHYGSMKSYKQWPFKFKMTTEAGHTYYIYYELVSGQPALGARDLGKDFEPNLSAPSDARQSRTPMSREKTDPYYEELKTQGIDQPIEFLR